MKFSDETINAYADNELHGTEKTNFEQALQHDATLQLALNNIYALKKQFQSAYNNIHVPKTSHSSYKIKKSRLATYAAMLLLTFSIGWISSDLLHTHAKTDQVSTSSDAPRSITGKPGKYIIHIGKRNDNKFRQTLTQIEALLSQNDSQSKNIELEIIANAGGLDLLRVGVTPYTYRVQQLIANHPNIKFIACANTLERLKEQGKEINLILAVQHNSTTAIDQVIRRVNDGWTYVKI